MLQASDYNFNLQIFCIEEDGNLLPHWDFPTLSAAEGYVATFGAGRNLRIVHCVKVRDSKRHLVPVGTPTLWVCQKKVGSDISYMGNPHLAQSSADFWTGIYGGPNETYKTKMLAEYLF